MERISALMDGESDRNDVAQVVRQMKDRSELREAWSTYHLIGEAMRGERCADTQVLQAVCTHLAAEPTVLAPKRNFGQSLRRFALPSMAAAAAVAAVSWVTVQTYRPAQNSIPMAESVVPWVGEPISLVSSTQPPMTGSSPPAIQLPSRRIDAYLEAHQEFSPSRTIQGLASYARTVSATGSDESGR